jgi:hypothetical protein
MRRSARNLYRKPALLLFHKTANLPTVERAGPPKLVGALLIVSITVGYLATDKLIAAKFSSKAPSVTREMCGGPTGDVISRRAS